jgi:ADP-heptose:LPS heptosyltransferase
MISASLIFNIRSKKIIGFNREQFRTIYDLFNFGRVRPQLIDMYLDAIVPFINIPDRNGLKNQQISSNPSGEILIHPFAGWREKEWKLKNFISLAERLNKDYSVCLITAAGQLSVDVLNDIEYADVKVRQTASVEELIKCIKECSLFIGNDSGPIYIANFIGKPTITIHGATSFEYTTTYLAHQICIQKVLKCSARPNEQYCTIRAAIYNCPGIQCMNLLTVDEVFNNATPLIEEYCNKKT